MTDAWDWQAIPLVLSALAQYHPNNPGKKHHEAQYHEIELHCNAHEKAKPTLVINDA